jgi:hypothetical protein
LSKPFVTDRRNNQGKAEAKKLAAAAIHVATAAEGQAPPERLPKKCRYPELHRPTPALEVRSLWGQETGRAGQNHQGQQVVPLLLAA